MTDTERKKKDRNLRGRNMAQRREALGRFNRRCFVWAHGREAKNQKELWEHYQANGGIDSFREKLKTRYTRWVEFLKRKR